mgnify:CR=1 FL=1
MPFIVFGQITNHIDDNGNKQGYWVKYHQNGEIRYKGQFKDNVPQGLFLYYYKTGELQIEKKFFNNGEATAAHFFYKNGGLQSSGLYVSKLTTLHDRGTAFGGKFSPAQQKQKENKK